MKIGIIGCGNISTAYLTNAPAFPSIEVAAIADLRPEAAQAQAAKFGVKALPVEELLSDPEIKAVVNLTIPAVHADVDLQILRAGKHAYSEKPLATDMASAQEVLGLASKLGLRVGCAPDTFLGAGQQTARALIDRGTIGTPLSGTIFMLSPGPESWHPNPGFLYAPGGGPLFDIGPYYITTLVNLLGPVQSVFGSATRGYAERICGHESIKGQRIPVGVPTHYAGVITFHSGAVITVGISFDVQAHSHRPIEIYGTAGSMAVPDPNGFGGDVLVKTAPKGEWNIQSPTHGYPENARIIGLVDLLDGVKNSRPSRCDGLLAQHVLEVMLAFEQSHDEGRRVEIQTCPERPVALPENHLFT